MPKKILPTIDAPAPPSETVRVAGDLMEMMRAICYHTRAAGGKRPKISQLLDDYVRSRVEREYAGIVAGKEGGKK